MVKIYSKEKCPQCVAAKAFMKGRGIQFEELNTTENEEHMEYVLSTGLMSFPVIVVEGKDPICGFKPNDILELIK